MDKSMDATGTFEEYRSLLFSIAYRMLGSVAEAEDVVQDAFMRWQEVDLQKVESPKAYLSSIATRLSLDVLRSARVQREQYVGPWLPEPLVTDPGPDAQEMADMSDSLSMAFLVMLERLNPIERAVFLLHDVFAYSHEEIAGMVSKSEENCRQILHRARKNVKDGRSRFEASRAETERLTSSFLEALVSGDVDGFRSVLTNDVVLWTDGGGRKRAARKPIYGPDKVVRWFLGVAKKEGGAFRLRPATVNGQPGLLIYGGEGLDSVLTLDVADSKVQGILVVRNPDKLRHLSVEARPSL